MILRCEVFQAGPGISCLGMSEEYKRVSVAGLESKSGRNEVREISRGEMMWAL